MAMVAVSKELNRLLGCWIKADDATREKYEQRAKQEDIPAFCLFVREQWHEH